MLEGETAAAALRAMEGGYGAVAWSDPAGGAWSVAVRPLTPSEAGCENAGGDALATE